MATAEELLSHIQASRKPADAPTGAGMGSGGDTGTGGQAPSVAALWDRIKAHKEGTEGSGLGALWEGLKHGVTETAQGVAQLGEHMPSLFGGAGRQKMLADINQRIARGAQAYEQSPQRQAHPIMAGTGRFLGNAAATAPLAMLPGGAASLAGRIGMGAAAGGLGAATQPVAGGDYWAEKAKQAGTGMVAGGTLGGAGRLMGPPLTQAAQDAISKFPHIAGIIRGTAFRSADNFNRGAVNQALDPIGAVIPPTVKAGHRLIEAAHDRLTDAYNQVLPNLAVRATPALKVALDAVKADDGRMSDADLSQLTKFIKGHMETYFVKSKGAPLDGTTIKRVQHEFGELAASSGTSDALAGALHTARDAFMQEVEQQNPAWASQLKRVNQAYAMFTRVRAAAAKTDENAAGVFTPHQLHAAARLGDKTAGKGAFSEGRAPMQAVAEAAAGPMSAPRVNRILTEILGAAAGAASGHPRGALGGAVAGALGPEITKGVVRATQNPIARGAGAGVSALAPSAGAEVVNQRRSYLRSGNQTTSPP